MPVWAVPSWNCFPPEFGRLPRIVSTRQDKRKRDPSLALGMTGFLTSWRLELCTGVCWGACCQRRHSGEWRSRVSGLVLGFQFGYLEIDILLEGVGIGTGEAAAVDE